MKLEISVEDLVKKVHELMDEKLGTDITVLNIGEISSVAEYFIIASANSERQLKAIADHVEDTLAKDFGLEPRGKEGHGGSAWIILDYGDIMVHVFKEEERSFYNLERIWKDSPIVSLEETTIVENKEL